MGDSVGREDITASSNAERTANATLSARIRAGDERAFEELFVTYAEALRRFAHRHVRSRETAAEIVQDVFCSVWHGRERLDEGDALGAYLFRATRNRALDLLDRENVRRRWLDVSTREAAWADAERVAAPPDEEARSREIAEAIDGVLAAMPERRSIVCELRWKRDVPPREIAETLGVALKTVETQISRGLRELRIALSVHRDPS
jgi:RNA polymerase sigma-70 factor, ECF subfamily